MLLVYTAINKVGKNGFIGAYAGFNIFTSNTAVTTAYSASAKTATETLLFGIDYATAFALQLAELEPIRLESFLCRCYSWTKCLW